MRLRLTDRRLRGKRELVVALRRGESLNPRQATWLQERRHKNYLAFDYDYEHDATDAVLRYDVSGLTSLRSYLARRRSGTDITRLLVNLAEALSWCVSGGNRYLSMLFDVRHAFVDASGELRLAFVPIDGATPGAANSPLTLLHALGNVRRLRLTSPNDVVLAEHVAAYVLGAENTFSLNEYRVFVASECHVAVGADATVSGAVLPASSAVSVLAAPASDASSDSVPTQLGPRPNVAVYRLVRVATGETYALVANMGVRVGRGSSCGARVTGNPKVSREHAVITCMDTGALLRDLGSANGTAVGGTAVGEGMRVAYGQHFSLADEEFYVMDG